MIAGILRGVANAALFAVAFAAVCVAIGRFLPLPDVPQVKEKLDWLRVHPDGCNALFLGTSRVRRQLIPSLFDRLAAEQGMEIRSFNLGVDSLVSPEDGYVLDQALREAPSGLRYVFIELSYFRADFNGQGAETIRSAYWHDWERTRVAWRQLVSDEGWRIKPLKKRKQKDRGSQWIAEVSEWCGVAAAHGWLFLQRSTNLGRGADWWLRVTGLRAPANSLVPLGPQRDGFIPSHDTIGGSLLAEYRRQVAAIPTLPARQLPFDPVPQEYLESMVAKVRARGAEPILFIAPTSGPWIFRPRRVIAPMFDFSDPQQWPELFDPRYRADIGHLNTAGADVFTRALAARFLAEAKAPSKHR